MRRFEVGEVLDVDYNHAKKRSAIEKAIETGTRVAKKIDELELKLSNDKIEKIKLAKRMVIMMQNTRWLRWLRMVIMILKG
uniref:Uncharacterized protein n=1 Tax=Arundo donax TaxID=35708 RepID=A0A0A8YIG8_ARUDO